MFTHRAWLALFTTYRTYAPAVLDLYLNPAVGALGTRVAQATQTPEAAVNATLDRHARAWSQRLASAFAAVERDTAPDDDEGNVLLACIIARYPLRLAAHLGALRLGASLRRLVTRDALEPFRDHGTLDAVRYAQSCPPDSSLELPTTQGATPQQLADSMLPLGWDTLAAALPMMGPRLAWRVELRMPGAGAEAPCAAPPVSQAWQATLAAARALEQT